MQKGSIQSQTFEFQNSNRHQRIEIRPCRMTQDVPVFSILLDKLPAKLTFDNNF